MYDGNMRDTVLVTGASSGVGRSIASHLANDYDVVAVARRLERMNRFFADEEHVFPYRLDLEALEEIPDRIEDIRDEHGHISYLVNNAAVNVTGSVEALEPADTLTLMTINAVAPITLMRELLADMKSRDFGRVVNVTSGAPLECPEHAGAYSASKAALNTLTVTAAKECADSNVKINLMSPGPCRTEMAPNAPLDPRSCLPTLEYLLTLDEDGPTGQFFWLGHEVPLFPDIEGVEWEKGAGTESLTRVIDNPIVEAK